MTRWWTYAVLAIALVAGSVRVQASPHARERCEVRESASVPASAARKRHDAPTQAARRSASGTTPLVVVPDRFELAAPARACVVLSFVVGDGRASVRVIRACSRAPPVPELGCLSLTQLARSRSTHGSVSLAHRGARRRWRHLSSRR